MSLETQLLGRLKSEQQQFALEGLKRATQRDNFEYGYKIGVVAGYDAAISALLDLIRAERDDERSL